LHDNISIDDIINNDNESITIKVRSHFDFGLKLSFIIRLCLGLSANQLMQMIEAKVIYTPENYLLKKHKVKNGDIVLISREKLQKIYK